MNWSGIMPHVKTVFYRWIKCQAFDVFEIQESPSNWQDGR